MTRYFIRTWTEESTIVCEYGFEQWKEVIKSLRDNNRKFKAWKEQF